MRMLKIYITLLVLVVVSHACSYFIEDELFNQAVVQSPVFGCCNEWEGFGTDENTVEERVQLLFDNREIRTTNIWLTDNEHQVVCFHCCQCPREKVINVAIDETLITQAEAFGFRPN